MANINKIKLSGTSYDIQDSNAARSVTLTQAQYDALQTKDPNVFYIISDSSISYMTSGDTESAITQAVSGKADTSAVTSVSDSLTAHTANTTVHVTAQDKTNWNAKSDFSGSYNDLTDKPTIPTVPTSNTAFTNDAGYITSNDITGKTDTTAFTAHTADTTIHVTTAQTAAWNAKSDFSGSYNDLTNKLSAGTNVSIIDNVISAEGGGGKAIEAGRGIAITTGATADTVSFNLPISAGTSTDSIKIGSGGSSDGVGSVSVGYRNTANGQGAFAQGGNTWVHSLYGHTEGQNTEAAGNRSHAEGYYTTAKTESSHTEGRFTKTSNRSEHAEGEYNISVSASTTFGDSGNTLFSVGNGTSNSARHNAFEIRQNGDIYITKDGSDIKLQDQLGGGGSSYSAGTGIDITSDVISVTGMTAESAFTAHTADTTIHVTTAQTAAWDAKSNFSGSYNDLTDKPTIPTSASQLTNDSGYITSSALDGYATTATTSALNNTLTAHTADTTIHVTSSDKSSWNGAATNASNAVTALGGLSLVKLTQAQYDALATKDSNTLYVING